MNEPPTYEQVVGDDRIHRSPVQPPSKPPDDLQNRRQEDASPLCQTPGLTKYLDSLSDPPLYEHIFPECPDVDAISHPQQLPSLPPFQRQPDCELPSCTSQHDAGRREVNVDGSVMITINRPRPDVALIGRTLPLEPDDVQHSLLCPQPGNIFLNLTTCTLK